MKKRVALALALATTVALVAGVVTVFGHADYDHSAPNDGEVLTTAPARVDAYFTQDMTIAPGENNLNVVGPGGADVDNNDAVVDPDDHTHMSVTLQSGLVSGEYTVEWSTTSFEDGDDDSGTFTFSLELAEEPQPTAPAGGPTSTPGPVLPSTGLGPSSSGTGAVSAAIAGATALGLAALAFGAAMGTRRRGVSR